MIRKSILSFVYFLLLCAPLYADKMRLAILDFEAKSIDKVTAKKITEWIRTEMIATGKFLIMERSAMNAILKEQQFGQTGCTDTSCAVKLGKMVSANKIMIGSVEKWGKKYYLNGRIIDVEKGVAEFAHREKEKSFDNLDECVTRFAKNLVRRIEGRPLLTQGSGNSNQQMTQGGTPVLATESSYLGFSGQWASSVINFSSQYSKPGWAATQALGRPTTFQYGDYQTSWATKMKNGGIEFIDLGYRRPAYCKGVIIRETYGNGFVFQIELKDINNVYHRIWKGTDNSQPGMPVDFKVTWEKTKYKVKGIKIFLNTRHNYSTWEEIDAVFMITD